jgi:hypothetical protein
LHPSGLKINVTINDLSTLHFSSSHLTMDENIAVIKSSAVYLDTDFGIGFSNVSAIARGAANSGTTIL